MVQQSTQLGHEGSEELFRLWLSNDNTHKLHAIRQMRSNNGYDDRRLSFTHVELHDGIGVLRRLSHLRGDPFLDLSNHDATFDLQQQRFRILKGCPVRMARIKQLLQEISFVVT